MTYGSKPTSCLNTSKPPITYVATNRQSREKKARSAQIGNGAELRGGGNSLTPQLRSGAYDQEASSPKQAKTQRHNKNIFTKVTTDATSTRHGHAWYHGLTKGTAPTRRASGQTSRKPLKERPSGSHQSGGCRKPPQWHCTKSPRSPRRATQRG